MAARLRANILTKFPGPETATLEVECRALICRTIWKDAPENWHNQFYREPWFRKMVDGVVVGWDVYYMMAEGPRADGMGFLLDLVKRFEAGRAPDDCLARHPATGTLKVRFRLPKTGEENDDGVPGRISATYGDALAGTPLSKCMGEAIARDILPAPLPELPVGGAVLTKRFEFPRKPDDLVSRQQ